MGTYRAPDRLVDTSLLELNKQIAGNVDKYDELFAKRKEEQKLQMEKNEKLLREEELARANSYEKWNTELRRTRPAGGYQDHVTAWLQQLGDEYYNLSGKTDAYSLKRIGQLMSVPQQLAEGQGAMMAISKQYGASLDFAAGEAGSVSPELSNNINLKYVIDFYGKKDGIRPSEEGGRVSWNLHGNILNNNAFVQGALEGNDFIRYNGDLDSVVDGTVTGVKTGIGYDKIKGQEVRVLGDTKEVAYISNVEKNNLYRSKMKNFSWKKTIDNQDYMETVFPQLVREVQLAYQKDIEAGGDGGDAGLLLYGEDRKKGGAGKDLDYSVRLQQEISGLDANAQIGPYVGNNDRYSIAALQREIAKYGFYQRSISDKYLQPDKINTGLTYDNRTKNVDDNSTAEKKNFRTNVQKLENIKLYKDNLAFSKDVVKTLLKEGGSWDNIATYTYNTDTGEYESSKPGAEVIKPNATDRMNAIEKIARKLNEINQLNIKTLDASQKGEWMLKGDNLVFQPADVEADDQIYGDNIIGDVNKLNQLLTVAGEGMNKDVFNYYKNHGIGSKHFDATKLTTEKEIKAMKAKMEKGDTITVMINGKPVTFAY